MGLELVESKGSISAHRFLICNGGQFVGKGERDAVALDARVARIQASVFLGKDGMELIKNGAAVLYQPTATVHGVFVREGDTWKIRGDTWNITPAPVCDSVAYETIVHGLYFSFLVVASFVKRTCASGAKVLFAGSFLSANPLAEKPPRELFRFGYQLTKVYFHRFNPIQ
ncbi:MAG: hypothetical protein WB586_09545 [Chthoniobacterales bacterium]